jgi:L-fucose isomerase-like protein
MKFRKIKAGFVGFGEVNSPKELIDKKCREAARALEERGIELVYTNPVRDDPEDRDVVRARSELSRRDFDFLVVCIAGWIPSHAVIDVISEFAHKPMVLWGLAGHQENGRLVSTADQAGTSALREPMDVLGYKFKYVYDTVDSASSAAEKVASFGSVARAAALLRHTRIGMMGYRDMNLYVTLLDQLSLRKVIGPEVEVFEMLEVANRMEIVPVEEVRKVTEELRRNSTFEKPVDDKTLEKSVRMFLAVKQKIEERGYQAVSLKDVDGVKKLMQFPPGLVLMLLTDMAGVASIPENDGLGAVMQLIVRYLTGQPGAYLEIYEFLKDRVLMGVPDFVPSEIVDGPVRLLPAKFGDIAEGILNVSQLKTGRITLCHLASRGDRYRLHICTGQAVTPRKWEEAGWTQPAPQLPSLEIILDGSMDEFAQKVLSEHYIIAYGDHRQELVDLCNLLGIEVI